MKNIKLILGTFLLFFTLQSSAQVSVSLNIGGPRDWCDHHDERVQYVYLPELECYYDNYASVYLYMGPNGWIRSRYLPEYCHGYDINRARYVVIDYRGHSPWRYFNDHRRMYYRDGYRNYRQEYYRPQHRRSNHVAVVQHRDYDNGPRYYKRDRDDNDRGGHGNGRGHGNGHGHGRR